MDLKELAPLAETIAANGAPLLAKVLLVTLPPPFNLLASTVLNGVSAAFGTPPGDVGAAQAAIASDPDAAADKLRALELQYKDQIDFAQLQTALDAKEAESSNMFVAGWRPAFAWSCILFIWYQVVETAMGFKHPITAEMFNPIWMAFTGMLGLRTVDKILGVATEKVHVLPKRKR